MKKLIAVILCMTCLFGLLAMPVGAAQITDPVAVKINDTVRYCDMFYESIEWYVVCKLNSEFVGWDFEGEPPLIKVTAAEYEAKAAQYCVLSEELLLAIRNVTDYNGNPIYDPETDTYTAFFIGGWGGGLPARTYAGYIKTGVDTYDVYYEHLTYEFLDQVLPDGMTTEDIIGDEWPDTVEYGGNTYQNGMDGYYRVFSYDKYGVKYGVKLEDDRVLMASRKDYEVGEQPEKFDDVNVAPTVITKQPAKTYVKAGKTAKFSVRATGTGLTYQWQVSSDGKNWENSIAKSANSATLSFTAKTSHSSNYYRCKITNAAGTITYTNVVRLYVLGITSQPKTQKVEAGEKAKFNVAATGAGKTYQWQVSSDGKSWKNSSAGTANSASLAFTAKTSHSNNYYRCKVTDSAGNTVYTDVVRLYVLGITTQPKTQKVEAGEKAKFTVAATGAGKTYQWQVSSDGKNWKNSSAGTANSASLSFTVKTSHSSNYYRCKVTDSAGNTVYTNAVRLYVLGITTQPKTQTVEAGEKVKFTVKATGAGLKYQWQVSFDGKTWKNSSAGTANSASLSFAVKNSHSGNYYRCKITDSAGNVIYTIKVRLTVK